MYVVKVTKSAEVYSRIIHFKFFLYSEFSIIRIFPSIISYPRCVNLKRKNFSERRTVTLLNKEKEVNGQPWENL